MKVLQPSELENQKREDEARKVQKTVKLHELVRDEEIALSLAKEEHRKRIEELATNFLSFSKEIDVRKSGMNKEIEVLEARKLKALEPLDEALSEARKEAERVKELEKEFQIKLNDLDKDRESIQEKTKELEFKKKELQGLELRLATEAEGLATTRKKTLEGVQKLERDTRFYQVFKDKIFGENRELDMDLQRQKVELETQKQLIEDQKKRNEEDRKRLDDRAQTLQDAFEELKNKQ